MSDLDDLQRDYWAARERAIDTDSIVVARAAADAAVRLLGAVLDPPEQTGGDPAP